MESCTVHADADADAVVAAADVVLWGFTGLNERARETKLSKSHLG